MLRNLDIRFITTEKKRKATVASMFTKNKCKSHIATILPLQNIGITFL